MIAVFGLSALPRQPGLILRALRSRQKAGRAGGVVERDVMPGAGGPFSARNASSLARDPRARPLSHEPPDYPDQRPVTPPSKPVRRTRAMPPATATASAVPSAARAVSSAPATNRPALARTGRSAYRERHPAPEPAGGHSAWTREPLASLYIAWRGLTSFVLIPVWAACACHLLFSRSPSFSSWPPR